MTGRPVLLVFLLFSVSLAAAQVRYSVQDLGSFGGMYGTTAWGISPSGKVVGSSDTGKGGSDDPIAHAFIWSAATGMVDLGTVDRGPFCCSSTAGAVNDSGLIVGTVQLPHGYF